MTRTKRKHRTLRVGPQKVAVVIYPQADAGSPEDQDEWGRAWVCEYNRDSLDGAATWLQGFGVGPSEEAAVRAFVADCHRRAADDL